jgi:hypothetical protein
MNDGNALRRRASAAAIALAALALTTACDETRPQKPKVISLIPEAVAQTTDLVVSPAAVSGAAMQPVDEAFALFAASSSLAEVEAARLALKG